jgi:6-phosphofructokinase 1
MITRQGGAIVPIPFEKLMDPKTGKTRVRLVDPTTDAHRSARSLQVRLERADLEDAGRLAALAKVTNLSPEATRARFADIV